MNSLDHKSAAIDELKLNQGYYFQTFLQEAVEKKAISESRLEAIRYGILELVTKEVDRYNNGESSSIPIEKAQELLQSISYLIGACLKTAPDRNARSELLEKETMTVLFWRGVDMVDKLRKDSTTLLKQIQAMNHRYKSISYHDTIFVGLEEALHDYNTEFGAHEAGGSIDYPLLIEVQDYLGMEYIYHYLKHISLEDSILYKFALEKINRLLTLFDPEAEHLLINLCEITVINALGCLLLGKDCRALTITRTELGELKHILSGKREEDIGPLLEDAITSLGDKLALTMEQVNYLMGALPEWKVRLWNSDKMDTLDHFFILTDGERMEREELYGGTTMKDEELRDFILTMGSLNTLQAKVSLIKEKVRSVVDLMDLLEECFYPEEYQKVYQLLGEEELQFLKKCILQEAGNIALKDYEPETEWQKQLLISLSGK